MSTGPGLTLSKVVEQAKVMSFFCPTIEYNSNLMMSQSQGSALELKAKELVAGSWSRAGIVERGRPKRGSILTLLSSHNK